MNKTNKKATFNSRENTLNQPELILKLLKSEVSTERSAHIESASEVQKETKSWIIYPNPVRGRFMLQIGNRHQHAIGLSLVSEAGNFYQLNTIKFSKAGSVFEVDIIRFQLTTGNYLHNVQFVSDSETLKVLLVR